MNTGNVLQKIWALPLVMLLAAFMSVGSASAQNTYYVDIVSGNNTFDGSQMAVGGFPAGPFQTIAQAMTTAVDGDTIVILANDYSAQGVITPTENLTFQVQTSGGNTVITLAGITLATAGKTASFADAAGGGTGTYTVNGPINLTNGTVNFATAVTITTGQTITRGLGSLTGTAPTTSNVNVTYNGALAGTMTSGNELPASLGTGKLTVSHTGALLSIPNALSVNDVQTTTAGAVTFGSTLTTTGNAANSIDIDGTGTFTVSGAVTSAGGVDIDAAATVNLGATSVANGEFNNNTGTVTVASLNLTDQNVTNTAGTMTVTGDLRVGVTGTATRVTVTAGTMTVGSLTADALVNTAGNEADVIYTINNDATFTVNGAITEGQLAVTNGVLGETETGTEFSVFTIDNATGQEFSIGASSTIRGDINNAERDAGADGDGIKLNNNAVLTVLADADAAGATITSFGDFIGGTLVLNYANGNTDSGDATNNQSVTLVNNLTYGSNTATLAAPAAAGDIALTVGGDLRLGAAVTFPYAFTVTGTVYIDIDNVTINAHTAALASDGANQGNWGGFSAGSNTATIGVNAETENVTITGSTNAAFNDSDVHGSVTATAGPAGVTASAGASFNGLAAGSLTLSGNGQVDNDGPLDVNGNVTVPSGHTLDQTALGGASDIDGVLDLDGTFAIAGGGTLTIDGNVDIDATTGALTTANATTFNFGANFTGGTYTDTGQDDTVVFNTPSGGSTISVKPGTAVDALTINGSGRTATVTESISVDNGVTLGNDVTVALGANSFVLTGGNLTLNDEAQVTNSGTDGSIQFTGAAAQTISVVGVPTTNPTLQNIVVNNTAAAPAVDIDNPINIAGTLTVLNGVVRADNATVTFTGSNAKIAYAPESTDPIATNGTGAWAGTRDLDYIGTLTANRAAGAEFTATNIRNLSVTASGAFTVTLPATAATITGNLSVSNNGATLTAQEDLTVNGNATINGNFISGAGDNLSVAGALTVTDGDQIVPTGAMEVILTGASQTHSIQGQLAANTTLRISGTGTTVNGFVANPGGDADADAEFQNIIIDASRDATFNTVQVVNGTVTVNGTGTLNMVTDGGNAGDANDGQILGAIDVNNGGSLTVSTTSANATLASTTAVDDGGTFTMGSNLTAVGDVTVGNTSQATAATFNLNGNTLTTNATAGALTVNASTTPSAPSFGTTGTVTIPNGGEIAGGTNPTIQNVTINGGAAIDSDVTVTGTFTVTAASTGENGDNVTLNGANATGQFNANYTGTAGAAGTQIITTGTNINSTVNGVVTITNLNVASTSTTTMAYNGNVGGGATNFNVAYLNHDSGVLDITNETFTMVGDGANGTDDWDHDGGTYAGTGTYVFTGAGPQPIDMDTNGVISLPNVTINGAANQGLQIDAAGDGMSVTGTLTLNGAGPNVQTEAGATDASFSVGNGATIVRSSAGAADHFDNAPTLGTGLTVRYTAAGATTTANELPTTLTRLEWEGAATLTLEDGVALTTDQLESGNNIDIDANDDGDNSITITDGGRIEYDNGAAGWASVGADETPSPAGAITYRWDATDTSSDLLWPDAQTSATVSVTNGTLTLHESRTAGAVVVGDGVGAAASAILDVDGVANATDQTLTATSVSVNSDGSVIATDAQGSVSVSGALTNSGAFTANVSAQNNVTLTGTTAATNPASLTLNGTAAQTLTIPNAATAITGLTINNTAGVTLAGGGNLTVGTQTIGGGGTVTAVQAGLTLTNGTLNLGSSTLLLPHGGSGLQGFTRTNGCVYGNVRKQLSNTTNTAPADRLDFPLCSMGGVYRPYAITFNNPNTIGGVAPTATPATTNASPAITVKHDVAGENSVAELSGTNGLAQTVNGVMLARYPQNPSFFWTVSPSFTMSPSLSYDVDMRANDYSSFSSSCGTEACDINEIYPIRRHVGSNSNLWTVASSTIDNFLAGADDPVVIGRAATGALQTSGTIFTYGLKSIFASANATVAVTTTTGNAHVQDISTLFTGFTGALTYTAVASDATGVTNPTTANVAGNNLTVTGGADAGSATVTVNATDSFGSTASATFTVTNSAALAAGAVADMTLNVGDTATLTFAGVFSGGAGTVAYSSASSDASVGASDDGTTVTLTAASAGTATITLTGTDGSSTPVTVNQTFMVTVNNAVSVANAVADQTVLQGATADIDVSNVFANGTGAITVSVSGGNTTAGASITGNTVTISGLAAYSGTPLADTAPVTVTLTGTDTIGGSITDQFDVTVNPVAGAVSGGGAVSAFDAALILDEFLGKSNPALTAKQLVAADFDGDNDIDPFDAYQVYVAAGGTPKADIRNAYAAADVAFGEMTQNGTVISLPIVITGDVAEAAAVSFQTTIDPAIATVAEVVNNSDWIMATDIAEDGTVRFAAIGGESLPSNGVIATIQINVPETFSAFMLNGQGAVNNNTISEIDAVEVIEIPGTFALDGNYPNPFNPTTTIQFDLPESADVEVQIFDMIGRQVMSVPSHTIAAGAKRSIQLNASQLASGSYFYRVVAKMSDSVAIDTGRMTLVK